MTAAPRPRAVHYAWIVAAVTFVTLLVAAAIRATPGVLIVSLEQAFGWSRDTISSAVAINLVLYGLIGPFAAAVMDRVGVRRTLAAALIRPHTRSSCHGWLMKTVKPAPVAIASTAMTITRRRPNRSANAAANGPASPKTIRLRKTAKLIVARLHPNSFCSGMISTPVVERKPAAVISVTSPTAATIQA